jgi:hypothetical protein
MSYSNFTLAEVKKRFNLTTEEASDLFTAVEDVPVSKFLTELLAESVPLALAIHTEKARSELMVSPILVELRKLCKRRISLFSGTDFDVDPERGLTGTADFIISRDREQLYITAPIVAIVEAKRDSIKDGLGQCIAMMVGAQVFNQREDTGITVVHGMVTTGSNWQALRLEGQTVSIDQREYYIEQLGRILGILLKMVGCPVATSPPAPALATKEQR